MPPETVPTKQSNEVPAEAAYMAAKDRALRTTQALIESEARVLDLSWRLDKAIADIAHLNAEVRATKELMHRRTETLRRRAEAAEGVTNDAPDHEAVRPETCGEADSPHAFSD